MTYAKPEEEITSKVHTLRSTESGEELELFSGVQYQGTDWEVTLWLQLMSFQK